MEFTIPARGLIGLRNRMLTATRGEAVMHHRFHRYEPNRGEIAGRTNGVMIATETGQVTAYALDQLAVQSQLEYCVNAGHSLKASIDYNEILHSDVTFICVGTPCNSRGSIDLGCIRHSATEIGQVLARQDNHHTVVVRSTVIPGTTEGVIIPALEESSDKKEGKDFSVAMNPEFLQEGRALHDFMNPHRIVIGDHDSRAGDTLQTIYKGFNAPIIRTDIKTAEMIKYANNAFLATKISFINEIGNICKSLGIDVYEVAKAIGQDPRIGNKFLNAGIGFGGSCLPKDVSALISKGRELGYKAELLQSVLDTNFAQPSRIIEITKKRLGSLKNKVIAILGLAFKPNTNDVRQAPALQIIGQLLTEGAKIKVYDPMAMPSIKLPSFDNIEFCSNVADAVSGSDCVIFATEWDEFRDENLYAGKLVIDGRRVLNPEKARLVCQYEGVCW